MSHDLKKWIRLQGEKHNNVKLIFLQLPFLQGLSPPDIRSLCRLELQLFAPLVPRGHHKFWPYLCLFTTFPTVINQHILWKKSDRKYWTLVNAFVFSLGSLPCKTVVFLILLYYLSKSWFWFFLQILYLFLKGQVGLIQANLS